jgi:broad specificity phosphatase PhoE
VCTRFSLAFVVVLAVVSPSCADEAKSYPARILIIRHAEKPTEGKSVELSDEGKERAKKLHKLFEKSDARPNPFPRPDFIFATADSKESQRPNLTVAPLAKKLGLKVNDDYANKHFAKLAHELLHDKTYAGKTVLVCWHHGTIPDLIEKLGAKKPHKIKDEVFDRVWQIEYDKKGNITFSDLPQRLMPGDSKK